MSRNAGTSSAFWDSFSSHYDALQQGDAPGRIVYRLMDIGVLQPEWSILEIRSGPGTYTIPLARHLKHVTATDVSGRMLAMNRTRAGDEGLTNIDYSVSDWHKGAVEGLWDSCLMAFVPLADSRESLILMEGCADHACIVIAWEINHGEDLTRAIGRALGTDWPHPAHDNTLVQLKGMDRCAYRIAFDTHISCDIPEEDVVAKEASRFASAGFDAMDVVRDIVSDITRDGLVHYDHTNRIGVTYWYPEKS